MISAPVYSPSEVESAIRQSWGRDTSQSPKGWTPGNPSYAQCVITSLVYEHYLGGEIVYGDVEYENEDYTIRVTQHFWNEIDGEKVDLTWEQFRPGAYLIHIDGPILPEELTYFETINRLYETLRERVDRVLQNRV